MSSDQIDDFLEQAENEYWNSVGYALDGGLMAVPSSASTSRGTGDPTYNIRVEFLHFESVLGGYNFLAAAADTFGRIGRLDDWFAGGQIILIRESTGQTISNNDSPESLNFEHEGELVLVVDLDVEIKLTIINSMTKEKMDPVRFHINTSFQKVANIATSYYGVPMQCVQLVCSADGDGNVVGTVDLNHEDTMLDVDPALNPEEDLGNEGVIYVRPM